MTQLQFTPIFRPHKSAFLRANKNRYIRTLTTLCIATNVCLCDTTFKLRYRNHVCSFKNERYKHATELSKYIWSLKDKSIPYNIKWRKAKRARSYSNISKRCNLCLWEKYFIIYKPGMSTLNNISERISNCRHSKKFLLKNVLA